MGTTVCFGLVNRKCHESRIRVNLRKLKRTTKPGHQARSSM